MREWMDPVAEALGQPPLDDEEMEALLDLARDASHATADRRTAPLTTFLAGQLVAATGSSRKDTIARARELVARALRAEPEKSETSGTT